MSMMRMARAPGDRVATFVIVRLVKAFGGSHVVLRSRNNLLRAKYAFDLTAAAFVGIATGAGIHSVATASSRPG